MSAGFSFLESDFSGSLRFSCEAPGPPILSVFGCLCGIAIGPADIPDWSCFVLCCPVGPAQPSFLWDWALDQQGASDFLTQHLSVNDFAEARAAFWAWEYSIISE